MGDLTPEILQKIKLGDEDAFAELAEMYAGMTEKAVRRFAPSFGITDSSADSVVGVDDLRQCAVMALYRAASTYRCDEEGREVSFGLYSKICVNNALISELRKHESEKRRNERARSNAKYAEKRSEDPLARIVSTEDATEMISQIDSCLSAFEKQVFDSYISGKSVFEIAEGLGKSEKSVSNALYRMKVKIKGLFKNQ